jgi:molybdopterin-containing oxidoreductase family iron-sulfur binding subunit
MMDMHRCIGCRYCIVGCPYGSRSFNWSDPRKHLDLDKVNTEFPTRSKGVVEKCNFCAERQRRANGGKWTPTCVEVCPEGALLFGDLTAEESEVRKILETRYTIRRKPGLGTAPHVFYVV